MSNREFKFRAWNKKLKFWYDGPLSIFSTLLRKKEVVVMQYTGIKDKNKKEVYEGDIVKAIPMEEHIVTTQHDETVISDVIFLEDLQFQVRSRDEEQVYEHGLPLAWGGWDSVEVIGNVYENPKLLKGQGNEPTNS